MRSSFEPEQHGMHALAAGERALRAGTDSGSSPSMGDPMSKNSIRCTWAGCAIVALAALTSSVARADITAGGSKEPSSVVVAQASTPAARSPQTAVPADTFAMHQRGVRQAAAESNEALRRYIWRTRMIYNFRYNDFASKE